MIKKWTVCLSIIILVLNFVPNLLQGHQVFAENQKNYKDKVELINDESFNISYSMRALENQYEWEIDYRINNAGVIPYGTGGIPQQRAVVKSNGISPALLAMGYKDPQKIMVINKESGMPRETNRVYSPEGLSPTLNTMQGGGREPKIAIPVLTPDRAEKRQNGRRFKENGDPMFTLTAQDRHGVAVKEATKQGFAIANLGDSINLSVPNSKTRRGRVGKQVAQTLDTSCNWTNVK